jgi:tripartite-type tricarboxylate transporter receptor subunit TctC
MGLICAILLAAALGAAPNASAQPYPTRPITIVVPFVAGGQHQDRLMRRDLHTLTPGEDR